MTPLTNDTVRHRSLGDHRWQDRAACQSTEDNPIDPDLFFPEPDEIVKIAAAKALCRQCPVRDICLQAALESNDTHGIRGGMTEEERQPLHEETSNRLDHSRVEAVLAGRDIHLTRFERRAAVHIAYERGVSEQRLGWLLKISEEHAQKLYREIRRAHRNVRLDMERPADITPRLEVDDERHGRNGFGTAA